MANGWMIWTHGLGNATTKKRTGRISVFGGAESKALAAEQRQKVAHGASRGGRRCRARAAERRKNCQPWFCRPCRGFATIASPPTAGAVGYFLTSLRGSKLAPLKCRAAQKLRCAQDNCGLTLSREIGELTLVSTKARDRIPMG